jgi:hypothetical protein
VNIKIGKCAGWDENSHSAFIWKNINGKKYCKNCSYKIEDKKTSINKISEKQKKVNKVKKENTILLHKVMYEWWKSFGDRKYCQCCNKQIPLEFSTINIHHLLPKRNYKDVDKCTDYYMLLCAECHGGFETSPNKIKHKAIYEATDIAKNKYYENTRNT